MRAPLPLDDQIKRLRNYMRTLRADSNRAYRESGADDRKRKYTPFVESLRYRRSSNAYELLEIAQECLKDLLHACALAVAEFAPGEQITMEVVMEEYERGAERFVVTDVERSARGAYNYVVWQVTKNGELFKRGTSLLCPSSRIRLARCDGELSSETLRYCEHFRESAREFTKNALERGKLDEIEKSVAQRRERRGW